MSEEFKFDFFLQTVAESWLKESVDAYPDVKEECDEDTAIGMKEDSFFASQNAGNIYFSVKNPKVVKQEWVENRRRIKADIKRYVRMLVWNKLRKER
ncbi:hypothetical protein EG68_07110 [Paragonimus skrjabini miyazakii]|uniref:Uncharacterized protein n=1 Tax=Paragonimus skrjabini miyazakii TaxID=59628 RepID=A0A8S9YQ39_9TREM|nr:hypothetical protein EG68_07110 [Paragonimus skrjabini miyazakii]